MESTLRESGEKRCNSTRKPHLRLLKIAYPIYLWKEDCIYGLMREKLQFSRLSANKADKED
jgi:hypothetical protein